MAMTNRQTVRVAQRPEKSSYSAAIVRLPLTLSVRHHRKSDERRPSLALNILLVVLLVLACFVWEAMAARNEASQNLRHSTETSPRAAAATGSAVA
jgi:hypothetical protein